MVPPRRHNLIVAATMTSTMSRLATLYDPDKPYARNLRVVKDSDGTCRCVLVANDGVAPKDELIFGRFPLAECQAKLEAATKAIAEADPYVTKKNIANYLSKPLLELYGYAKVLCKHTGLDFGALGEVVCCLRGALDPKNDAYIARDQGLTEEEENLKKLLSLETARESAAKGADPDLCLRTSAHFVAFLMDLCSQADNEEERLLRTKSFTIYFYNRFINHGWKAAVFHAVYMHMCGVDETDEIAQALHNPQRGVCMGKKIRAAAIAMVHHFIGDSSMDHVLKRLAERTAFTDDIDKIKPSSARESWYQMILPRFPIDFSYHPATLLSLEETFAVERSLPSDGREPEALDSDQSELGLVSPITPWNLLASVHESLRAIVKATGAQIAIESLQSFEQQLATLGSSSAMTSESSQTMDSEAPALVDEPGASSFSWATENNGFGRADRDLFPTSESFSRCLIDCVESGGVACAEKLLKGAKDAGWLVEHPKEPSNSVERALCGMQLGLDDIWIIEKLGEGSFSWTFEVCLVGNHASRAVLKLAFLQRSDLAKDSTALREIVTGRAIGSPHIIKMLGYFLLPLQLKPACPFTLGILLEKCECDFEVFIQGPLKRIPGKDRALKVLSLFLPLFEASISMKLQGKVHRDLKPSNIFVSRDGALLMGDFGLARMVDSKMTVGAGTPTYMPPDDVQAVSKEDICSKYDVYSLGMILFEAITGDLPKVSGHYQRGFEWSLKDIKRAFTSKRVPNDMAQDIANLCKSMVEETVEKRITNDVALRRAKRILAAYQENEADDGF